MTDNVRYAWFLMFVITFTCAVNVHVGHYAAAVVLAFGALYNLRRM